MTDHACSIQGTLAQFLGRLLAILVVVVATCLVPFRATAQGPPQAGSSLPQAAHVATTVTTCPGDGESANDSLAAEPIVDTSNALRGGSITSTHSEQLQRGRQADSSATGYALYSEPRS